MTIRDANIEDAEAIRIAEMKTAETPGLLVSRPYELKLAAYVKKIKHLSENGKYLVAEKDGRIVGHVLLAPMGLEAVAHVFRLTIVVHPGHTGKGVGTALMAALLDWAQNDERVQKVELLVRAPNEKAIRLYKKVGFAEEGRLKKRVRLPDGQFIDDVAMAWFPKESPAKPSIRIRSLQESDAEMISEAFAQMNRNKPVEQYQQYLREQAARKMIVLVAELNGEFAGYLKIVWQPDYPYFKANNTPEIQDLNVLLKYRRKGVATTLMDEAESIIAEKSPVVGIGVGLHPGYNAAQRMYVLRGYVPDAQGVVWKDDYIEEGQQIIADDDLVLHLTKNLK